MNICPFLAQNFCIVLSSSLMVHSFEIYFGLFANASVGLSVLQRSESQINHVLLCVMLNEYERVFGV